MTHRASFTIDDEAYKYLSQKGGDNKSAFLNRLLHQQRYRDMQSKMMRDNLEEAEDHDVIDSMTDWDVTLLDGLDDVETA